MGPLRSKRSFHFFSHLNVFSAVRSGWYQKYSSSTGGTINVIMVFWQKVWLPWEMSQTEQLSLCERTAKVKLRVRQTLEARCAGIWLIRTFCLFILLSFQTLTSSTSAQPDTAAENTIHRTKPKRACVLLSSWTDKTAEEISRCQ